MKLQHEKFNTIAEISLGQTSEEMIRVSDIEVFSNVHVFKLREVEELGTKIVVLGLKPILTENQRYIFLEEKDDLMGE